MPFQRLIILTLFIMLISCEKDENIPSRVALLTHTDWKLADYTSAPAYPFTINNQVQYFTNIMEVYKTYKSCHADQRYHFDTGTPENNYEKGIYTFSDGNATCSSSMIKDTGRWFFQDNSATDIILWRTNLNNTSLLNYSLKVYEVSYHKLTISERVQLVNNGTIYELKKTFVPVGD